uniref:ELM2 domain-containing protein n=1 Tax=Macrostomum lignano TaxID=282301 RepID=A0A1I8FDU2_9PLAT
MPSDASQMPVRCQSDAQMPVDASQMPSHASPPPLTIAELSHQPAPKQEAYRFDPDAGIKTFQQRQLSSAAEAGTSSRILPITKVENTLAWHPFTGQEELTAGTPAASPGPGDVELKPLDMFEDEDREGIRASHTTQS